jgi:hypothetical protein
MSASGKDAVPRPQGRRRAWSAKRGVFNGAVVKRVLLTVTCAAATLFPLASSAAEPAPMPAKASAGAAAMPPYPSKCPLSTPNFIGPNCLLDEGLRPCNFIKPGTDGCIAVQLTPVSWNSFKPVPNSNLHVSVSASTVAIGGTLTVHANIATPFCTYAMTIAPSHPRCMAGLEFSVSSRYVPVNYNGEFNPLRLVFGPNCGNGVESESLAHPVKTCTAKVLAPFGGRVLPFHYAVVTVEADLNLGGNLGDEEDFVQVALRVGHPTNCAATARGCPLKVFVRVLQPIRSGLAVDDEDRKDGPVNFTVPTYSRLGSIYTEPGEAGQKCVSGCANVLVTVISPKTHKPVAGAVVDVSVSPVAHVPQFGNEFLCNQSDDPATTHCGSYLSALKADEKGQVHLIYWAPSEISPVHPTLTATATKPCAAAADCPPKGEMTTNLTVSQNLIYHHDGGLSEETVAELVKLARDKALFTEGSKLVYEDLSEAGLEASFDWLWGVELAEELATGLPSIFTVIFFGTIEIYKTVSEIHDQIELIAGLLEALDLPATGLYEEPFETKVPAAPSTAFEYEILHGLFAPSHITTGGALWWDAQHLSAQYGRVKDQIPFRGQQLSLDVYEVSRCDETHPDCGPGYKQEDGIEPGLCFYLSGDSGFGSDWDYHFCIPKYNAWAWVQTQKDLKATAVGGA